MSRLRIRPRTLAFVAAGAVAVGIVTGAAEGGDKPRAPRPSRPTLAVPAPRVLPAPMPCRPRRAAERKPPSEALLRAFGVLRRERTDRDALPASALAALKRHGLEPVNPASARLLREGPDGAGAWIVPVPDVNVGFGPFACRPRLEMPPRGVPAPRAARRARARALRAARMRALRARELSARALHGTRSRALRGRERRARALGRLPRAVPPAPVLAAPLWPGRFPQATGPQEGVAVVSVGGVAGGGGGSLRDLLRGRAPVAVDPCFGPRRNMVGISGVVPDGVEAAFLTSEDGSAVRADVTDNAFSFVVPRDRRPQQRYVVWSGADGTPHVQPVFVPFRRGGRFCPRVPERIARLPRVSPAVFDQFGPRGVVVDGFFAPAPMFAPALPAPRPAPFRVPRPAVPVPVPRHAPPPVPAPSTPQAPGAIPAPAPMPPRQR